MNIEQVSSFLPGSYQSISEAAERLHIDPMQAKVFERIFGLKKVPLDFGSTVEPMLIEAAQGCIQKSGVKPEAIKWIIHTHTGNHISPFGESVARTVQQALGLSHATTLGTCMSKCASAFVAYQMAQMLLENMKADDRVLILTGDVTFTEILQFIPGTTIASDGACATLVSKQGESNKLVALAVHYYNEFSGGIWGAKEVQKKFEVNYNHYLADVIVSAVSKAGLSLDDIKLLLPHNVNVISWQQVSKLINVPVSRIFLDNVSETAHCFGADPILNFEKALDECRLNKGDYFLMASVGLGATFGAVVFQR